MIATGPGGGPRMVCKVGGSLLDGGWCPGLMGILRRTAPGLGILVLAGGGSAADRIRALHRRGDLDMSEAHWAAIRALDANALRLAGGCGPRFPVVTGPEPWPRTGRDRPDPDRDSAADRDPGAGRGFPAGRGSSAGRGPGAGGDLAVLAPSPLLRAEDPLPHSWDVTSDSIAAWVAARCGATRLVLLKARGDLSLSGADGGTVRLSASRAAGRGLVDRHLPAVLGEAAIRTWTVNGRHPERLLAFLTGDGTAATALVA